MNPARRMAEEDYSMVREAMSHLQRTVARLHAAGVPLRAGTDTLAPLTVPGASLHHELALYVEAGLTPEEAMAIATRGAADVFDVSGMGTLTEGAPADFVVFREDPTRDLAALASILAVVQDGRVFTREILDAQRARYRESFDGVFQRDIATPVMREFLRVALQRAAGINRARD